MVCTCQNSLLSVQVSTDPASHPKLHLMLRQVVGFDCVDDESKREIRIPTPGENYQVASRKYTLITDK